MAIDFKKMFKKDVMEDDYVEIDVGSGAASKEKIKVRPFTLRGFDDVNEVLNSLRDGYTIAVIDIKTLRSKDIIELKRAVSKIKKTVDAIEGSIAGFGENTLIVTPDFAEVHKPAEKKEKPRDSLGLY